MGSHGDNSAALWLRNTIDRNRANEGVGLFSVCSAHPWVLKAAMRHARERNARLCVESTSNQVNQFGGYTAMTPAQFVAYLASIAQQVDFPASCILLGGDHLGPHPWRGQPGRIAMENALALVRACVAAGYVKIHLDASMSCTDDPPGPLSDETVAQRAADMCEAAESASAKLPQGATPPMYVIGTEVPVPGGEQSETHALELTSLESMRKTLATSREAFFARGLKEAWERVIGLVVQPGVEFGDDTVFDYDPKKAQALRDNLPSSPSLVYEAHSTDYQKPAGLRQMVKDHFAILKVGPWLTFAFREAVFALSEMEREWLGGRKHLTLSRVPEALEEAMLHNAEHWKAYYPKDALEAQLARRYSYSDRSRYYWPEPSVQGELERLLANLSSSEIPLTLLSQHMPQQYGLLRAGAIENRPAALIESRIRQVLEIYSAATDSSSNSGPAAG